MEAKSRMAIARGGSGKGEGNEEMMVKGYRAIQDERALEI